MTLSDDVYKEPLTPNHLLYGKFIKIDYCSDEGETNNNVNIRYNYIKSLLDHYWKRWLNEYVVNLREKHKLIQSSNNEPLINVGDVVIIHKEKID